ncbi:MAG: YopT-type cysteine protease domain-containing protein [Enterobacteriaceae bacterium]
MGALQQIVDLQRQSINPEGVQEGKTLMAAGIRHQQQMLGDFLARADLQQQTAFIELSPEQAALILPQHLFTGFLMIYNRMIPPAECEKMQPGQRAAGDLVPSPVTNQTLRGHATAIYCDGGVIHFFDSNLGEVEFSREQDFIAWFRQSFLTFYKEMNCYEFIPFTPRQ